MAIAAMIRIMATTINSSISEKPFSFFTGVSVWFVVALWNIESARMEPKACLESGMFQASAYC
jgi:hypothetical protein